MNNHILDTKEFLSNINNLKKSKYVYTVNYYNTLLFLAYNIRT